MGVAPGRRLDANNNVRFASRGHVIQNRDLQEHQTEFRVGIKLDPGSSSAATLMGLMGAACVIALVVLRWSTTPDTLCINDLNTNLNDPHSTSTSTLVLVLTYFSPFEPLKFLLISNFERDF